MKITLFLSFWVTNSLFFYLASLVFPGMVVLGNNARSPFTAVLLSGLFLTVIYFLAPPLLKLVDLKVKKEGEKALVYFIFNFIGIWLIARFAKITGLGISAFWVGLILAAIVNLLQWGVVKTIKKG